MDYIKRLVECYVPVTTCNLRCGYCYVAQQGLFKQEPPVFEHSAQEIREALSIKRLGGICAVNLCAGGETLISVEVLQIIRELLQEGHYVMAVTNGLLTQRIHNLCALPKELRKRLFLKVSYHYLELKRLRLLDTYYGNIRKLKEAGVSFSVELMPCDEEIPLIDEIYKSCMDNLGALCHCTIGRSDIDPENRIPHLSALSFEDYLKTWKVFESELFDYKGSIFYKKQTAFCYAGEWSIYVNLGTGEYSQCYSEKRLGNIFENTEKPLYFEAVGSRCSQSHCYNGHGFLAWGNIPKHQAPAYANLRNRKTDDGSEWLAAEMKAFMSTKLYQSNKEYSFLRKWTIDHQDTIRLFEKWIKRRVN